MTNLERRIEALEESMKSPVQHEAFISFCYEAFNDADRIQKRTEAIRRWEEHHRRKIDERRTLFWEFMIFTTREQVEKYRATHAERPD